jgi:hypothetical protein
MGRTNSLNSKPDIDGIIFWGVDFDKLAAKVGETLKKYPPHGVKVIQYKGERDYPGWKKYAKKFTYIEEALDALEREGKSYLDLQNADGYYATKIRGWERKLLEKYKAKFSIELHDTPERRKQHYDSEETWDFNIELLTVSFNNKLSGLLGGYCKHMEPILKGSSNVLSLCVNPSRLYKTPYHQIVVEINHDPFWINEPKAVKDTCYVIRTLSECLRKEYPKLWKKYM